MTILILILIPLLIGIIVAACKTDATNLQMKKDAADR